MMTYKFHVSPEDFLCKYHHHINLHSTSGVGLRNTTCAQWRTQEFCLGGGQQIKLRTERMGGGSGGGSPLIRGSGGSCNLVQEISFHIVTFS